MLLSAATRALSQVRRTNNAQPQRFASYYQQIGGKRYDRELLEAMGPPNTVASVEQASLVLLRIIDGGVYTQIEKDTVDYVRETFQWEPAALEYLDSELREMGGVGQISERQLLRMTEMASAVGLSVDATPEVTKKKSYYKVVKGVRYDRALMESVAAGVAEHGVVSLEHSKRILLDVIDGGRFTNVEHRSVQFFLAEYEWDAEARDYLEAEIEAIGVGKISRKTVERISEQVAKDSTERLMAAAAARHAAAAAAAAPAVKPVVKSSGLNRIEQAEADMQAMKATRDAAQLAQQEQQAADAATAAAEAEADASKAAAAAQQEAAAAGAKEVADAQVALADAKAAAEAKQAAAAAAAEANAPAADTAAAPRAAPKTQAEMAKMAAEAHVVAEAKMEKELAKHKTDAQAAKEALAVADAKTAAEAQAVADAKAVEKQAKAAELKAMAETQAAADAGAYREAAAEARAAAEAQAAAKSQADAEAAAHTKVAADAKAWADAKQAEEAADAAAAQAAYDSANAAKATTDAFESVAAFSGQEKGEAKPTLSSMFSLAAHLEAGASPPPPSKGAALDAEAAVLQAKFSAAEVNTKVADVLAGVMKKMSPAAAAASVTEEPVRFVAPVSVVASVAASVKPFQMLHDSSFFSANPTPRSAGSTRVVTWNIERGYRLPKVIEELRRLEPDVLCLQELDIGVGRSNYVDTRQEIAKALSMDCAFACEFEELRSGNREPNNAGGGVHGNAVLSRFPLSDVAAKQFETRPFDWDADGASLREPRRGGRVNAYAVVNAPGLRLHTFSSHLELFADRVQRAAMVSELLAMGDAATLGDPAGAVCIGGDLNSGSDGGARLHPRLGGGSHRWDGMGSTEAEELVRDVLHGSGYHDPTYVPSATSSTFNVPLWEVARRGLGGTVGEALSGSALGGTALWQGKIDWLIVKGLRRAQAERGGAVGDSGGEGASDHRWVCLDVAGAPGY